MKRLMILVVLFMFVGGTAYAADAKVASKVAPAAKVLEAKAAPSDAGVLPLAPREPKDVEGAIEKGKEAIAAAKAGQWWYFSGLVLFVIMFILKTLKILSKLGRWKYIILPVLALAAAVLSSWKGGVSLEQAMGVFTSSWAMGMAEELWNHGILGKAHGDK